MSDGQQEGMVKPLPIVHDVPEDFGAFANHFVVQHDKHEFYLMFFDVHPPVVVGPDEIRDAMERINSVRARCVARLSVAAGRIPEIISALTRNYERYKATAMERDSSPEGDDNAN